MELVLVTNTSRNAVVELTEAGKYYSKKEYDIYVNGELFIQTSRLHLYMASSQIQIMR